ncbi:hypothetical protein ACJ6TS_02700 [Citrobacter telavivensis]
MNATRHPVIQCHRAPVMNSTRHPVIQCRMAASPYPAYAFNGIG